MRGVLLFSTMLCSTVLAAQAASAAEPIRGFTPTRIVVPRITAPTPAARPISPVVTRPIMPVASFPRQVVVPRVAPPTPHCPKPPVSAKFSKKHDYSRQTMWLIQQNIIMQAAMRAQESRPCDPSWSAKKLRRRGCPIEPLMFQPIVKPLAPMSVVELEAPPPALHLASLGVSETEGGEN